jgi:hypothetical protein
MRHIHPLHFSRLSALCLGLLCATQAWAQQPAEAERPALRPELARAAERLANHQHPYGMSEEVAQVRLQKMGFERAQSLRPAQGNAFQAEVMKNGESQKVEIDRITGAVKVVH